MASNKGKPPTRTDREILRFLQSGGIINWKTAFQKFGTNRLTDNIYRLRCAGNIIYDIRREYTNDAGIQKHYFNYSMVKPEVLNPGAKTEKAMKENGSIPEISRNIAKIADNRSVEAGVLFPDYMAALRS